MPYLRRVPAESSRDAYAAAIIEGNCLQKPTASTRRTSNQRLGELYALDPRVAIFRVLRRLWGVEPVARPQLAMLVALARDPLFMASASGRGDPLMPGADLQRAPVRDTLRALVGERMNEAVLEKVARNVSSSWTQTGHLEGRTFKVRAQVQASSEPRPAALAFALVPRATLPGFQLALSNFLSAACRSAFSTAHRHLRAIGLAIEAKRLSII